MPLCRHAGGRWKPAGVTVHNDGRRSSHWVDAWINGHKARRIRRVARAISSTNRIGVDRSRPIDDSVVRATGNENGGWLAFLDPVLQECKRIEIRQPRSTRAVMHAGDQEEPKKILGR